MFEQLKGIIGDAATLSRGLCSLIWNIAVPAKANVDIVHNLQPRPDGLFEIFIKQRDAQRAQPSSHDQYFALAADVVSPKAAQANGDVCRAILAVAVTGDKQHQTLYEEKRLIQFGHIDPLPPNSTRMM